MKGRYEVGCGAVVVLGLLATGLLALQVGAFEGFGERMELEVVFPDAAGLTVGTQVAVAGIEVGQVSDLRLDGHRARATLAIDPAVTLHESTEARIRSRSVLGEKYVQLVPGPVDGAVLVDGDVLPEAAPQVEIDQLVARIGPALEAVDPAAITRIVQAVDTVFMEDPEVLARVLRNADRTLSEAAETVVAGRQTLHRADQVLRRLDTTGSEVVDLVVRADALLATLQEASEPLPETIARADRVLRDLERALGPLEDAGVDLAAVLENFSELDEEALRRLLREDGVRVHLFGRGRR